MLPAVKDIASFMDPLFFSMLKMSEIILIPNSSAPFPVIHENNNMYIFSKLSIRTHLAFTANVKKLCYMKQQSHSSESARCFDVIYH